MRSLLKYFVISNSYGNQEDLPPRIKSQPYLLQIFLALALLTQTGVISSAKADLCHEAVQHADVQAEIKRLQGLLPGLTDRRFVGRENIDEKQKVELFHALEDLGYYHWGQRLAFAKDLAEANVLLHQHEFTEEEVLKEARGAIFDKASREVDKLRRQADEAAKAMRADFSNIDAKQRADAAEEKYETARAALPKSASAIKDENINATDRQQALEFLQRERQVEYSSWLGGTRPVVVIVPDLAQRLGETSPVNPLRRVITREQMVDMILAKGTTFYQPQTEAKVLNVSTRETIPVPTGSYDSVDPHRIFTDIMGVKFDRDGIQSLFHDDGALAHAKAHSDNYWTSQLLLKGWTRRAYQGVVSSTAARGASSGFRSTAVQAYLALIGRARILHLPNGTEAVDTSQRPDVQGRPRVLLIKGPVDPADAATNDVVKQSFKHLRTAVRQGMTAEGNRYLEGSDEYNHAIADFKSGKGYILVFVDAEGLVLAGEMGIHIGAYFEGKTVIYRSSAAVGVDGTSDDFRGNAEFAKAALAAFVAFLEGQGVTYHDAGMVTPYTQKTGGIHLTREESDRIFDALKKQTVKFPKNGELSPDQVLRFLFPDLREISEADLKEEIRIWYEYRKGLLPLFDEAIHNARLYAFINGWLTLAIERSRILGIEFRDQTRELEKIARRLEIRRELVKLGASGQISEKGATISISGPDLALLASSGASYDRAITLLDRLGLSETKASLVAIRKTTIGNQQRQRKTDFRNRLERAENLPQLFKVIRDSFGFPVDARPFNEKTNQYSQWIEKREITEAQMLGQLRLKEWPKNLKDLEARVRTQLAYANRGLGFQAFGADNLEAQTQKLVTAIRIKFKPFGALDDAFIAERNAAAPSNKPNTPAENGGASPATQSAPKTETLPPLTADATPNTIKGRIDLLGKTNEKVKAALQPGSDEEWFALGKAITDVPRADKTDSGALEEAERLRRQLVDHSPFAHTIRIATYQELQTLEPTFAEQMSYQLVINKATGAFRRPPR